ncbi:MAG: ferredoxin [Patescibacteria group bacterium]
MSTPQEQEPEIASVEVIRELCIGAASCVSLAPETFELDPEAKAIIKNPKGNPSADILAAAQSCPVNAIILKDKRGNQIWPKV